MPHTTIDFNDFAFGTTLDVVNAAIPGEFVTHPIPSAPAFIGFDPVIPNDMALVAPVDQRNPDPELAFYFPEPVISVTLNFTGDPDGEFVITSSFYDQAVPIDQLSGLTPVSITTGNEPVILTYSGSPILAVGMETTSNNLLYLTEISWQPVPIPPAVWLFGSGLIGLIGLAKRRVRL